MGRFAIGDCFKGSMTLIGLGANKSWRRPVCADASKMLRAPAIVAARSALKQSLIADGFKGSEIPLPGANGLNQKMKNSSKRNPLK